MVDRGGSRLRDRFLISGGRLSGSLLVNLDAFLNRFAQIELGVGRKGEGENAGGKERNGIGGFHLKEGLVVAFLSETNGSLIHAESLGATPFYPRKIADRNAIERRKNRCGSREIEERGDSVRHDDTIDFRSVRRF